MNGYQQDWEWGPPAAASQQLMLVLSRRMSSMLAAVAHELELTAEDTALLLLHETLWRHYHVMQHI